MRMSKLKWVLPFAISGLVITACGDEATDEKNAENLIGTWKSAECKQEEDKSGGEDGNNQATDDGNGTNLVQDEELNYEAERATFTETNLTYHNTIFTDANCTVPLMAAGIKGTYKTGADAGTTDVEGASPLNLLVTDYVAVPLLPEAVTYFNDNSFCDKSDWELNVEAPIESFECLGGGGDEGGEGDGPALKLTAPSFSLLQEGTDGNNEDNGPKKGATWYQIYSATDTTLTWGDEDTAKTDSNETRPTKLSASDTWTK